MGHSRKKKNPLPISFPFSFVKLFLVKKGDEVQRGGEGLSDFVVVIDLVEEY